MLVILTLVSNQERWNSASGKPRQHRKSLTLQARTPPLQPQQQGGRSGLQLEGQVDISAGGRPKGLNDPVKQSCMYMCSSTCRACISLSLKSSNQQTSTGHMMQEAGSTMRAEPQYATSLIIGYGNCTHVGSNAVCTRSTATSMTQPTTEVMSLLDLRGPVDMARCLSVPKLTTRWASPAQLAHRPHTPTPRGAAASGTARHRLLGWPWAEHRGQLRCRCSLPVVTKSLCTRCRRA